MSTRNTFGTKKNSFGGNIPIWLGRPVPKAIGGTLAEAYVKEGAFYPAGTPLNDSRRILTLFLTYEVVSVSGNDITLLAPGYAPKVGDKLQTINGSWESRADAITVTSVKKSSDNKCVIGGEIASGASVAASAILIEKSDLVPTGYLGHDIDLGELDLEEGAYATGDIVVMHRDGILIDRTPAAPIRDLMAATVPGVIQVQEVFNATMSSPQLVEEEGQL